jgi:hypothetical protein
VLIAACKGATSPNTPLLTKGTKFFLMCAVNDVWLLTQSREICM